MDMMKWNDMDTIKHQIKSLSVVCLELYCVFALVVAADVCSRIAVHQQVSSVTQAQWAAGPPISDQHFGAH